MCILYIPNWTDLGAVSFIHSISFRENLWWASQKKVMKEKGLEWDITSWLFKERLMYGGKEENVEISRGRRRREKSNNLYLVNVGNFLKMGLFEKYRFNILEGRFLSFFFFFSLCILQITKVISLLSTLKVAQGVILTLTRIIDKS